MNRDALVARFGSLWLRLGATGNWESIVVSLLAAYGRAERRYHTVDHLVDCLDQLDRAPTEGGSRDLAEVALWFHDAVYVPGDSHNESRSAEVAASSLAAGGASNAITEEVRRLVRMTDHVRPASDPTGGLVCDIDLSILGREEAEFASYEERIRTEYAAIPDPVYRAGRALVLQRLLDRERLFVTEHFFAAYEVPARRNLRRALAALEGSAQ